MFERKKGLLADDSTAVPEKPCRSVSQERDKSEEISSTLKSGRSLKPKFLFGKTNVQSSPSSVKPRISFSMLKPVILKDSYLVFKNAAKPSSRVRKTISFCQMPSSFGELHQGSTGHQSLNIKLPKQSIPTLPKEDESNPARTSDISCPEQRICNKNLRETNTNRASSSQDILDYSPESCPKLTSERRTSLIIRPPKLSDQSSRSNRAKEASPQRPFSPSKSILKKHGQGWSPSTICDFNSRLASNNRTVLQKRVRFSQNLLTAALKRDL